MNISIYIYIYISYPQYTTLELPIPRLSIHVNPGTTAKNQGFTYGKHGRGSMVPAALHIPALHLHKT